MIRNCELEPCAGGHCCRICGAGPYGDAAAKRNCRPLKCPLCLRVLKAEDRRQLARDGDKWHWWCPGCRISCGECQTCNQPKG